MQLGLLGAERLLLSGRERGPELSGGVVQPFAEVIDAVANQIEVPARGEQLGVLAQLGEGADECPDVADRVGE